jgi:hypothetical protein
VSCANLTLAGFSSQEAASLSKLRFSVFMGLEIRIMIKIKIRL